MSSPLAITDQKQTVRDLFAKFNKINDPLISKFTTSIPERFTGAADHIIGSPRVLTTDFVLQNRRMLKSFIKKFHLEAGTISNNIEDNIMLLDDPSTIILVSTHQPNLFAYGGVFKKIVLLEALKNFVQTLDKRKKIVNLFLIIDHDFVDELWVRLAQLPSMQHSSGIMELRLPVSESQRWKMVCNIPRPRQAIITGWKHQIRSWINKSTIDSDKKLKISNLEQFWQHVESSYSKSKSYADLNSFIMSRIVNETWNYSTLFVRLTEIPTVFENGFAYLISNFETYSKALRNAENLFIKYDIDTRVSAASHLQAPVWIHCKCGSKASAKIKRKAEETVLFGPCISCKTEIELNLGKSNNLDLRSYIHSFSPRAIPIPLLLSRDLDVSCYVSGTGGIGYLVDGTLISKKLGLDLPTVLVWPSKDRYNGIGQAQALALMKNTNIGDINAHLRMLARQSSEYEAKIRPLLLERSEKIRNGQPINELLTRLFTLKKEQRNIRQQISIAEKIRNAINLSPCIIDYAINFGIEKIEQKWRSHLLNKADLALPVEI